MKKKINEEGNYSYMKVGELREAIKDIDDSVEVYIRTCHNPIGNVCELGAANEGFISSWSAKVPIVIIEPACTDFVISEKSRELRRNGK